MKKLIFVLLFIPLVLSAQDWGAKIEAIKNLGNDRVGVEFVVVYGDSVVSNTLTYSFITGTETSVIVTGIKSMVNDKKIEIVRGFSWLALDGVIYEKAGVAFKAIVDTVYVSGRTANLLFHFYVPDDSTRKSITYQYQTDTVYDKTGWIAFVKEKAVQYQSIETFINDNQDMIGQIIIL